LYDLVIILFSPTGLYPTFRIRRLTTGVNAYTCIGRYILEFGIGAQSHWQVIF